MDKASTQDPLEYVAVWNTTDSSLLPVIRSLLTASGVPHIVQGEEALGLFPMGGVGGSQSTFRRGIAATILVPRERREEAERLIHESARTDI